MRNSLLTIIIFRLLTAARDLTAPPTRHAALVVSARTSLAGEIEGASREV